ncbi:MAG: DNA cytosine methyltransferase [Amphiplicatus sp.]
MLTYYEFFCGGGMVRAALGPTWKCLFANDIDPKKAASYRANWGGDELHVEDVANLTSIDLPDRADLAWASFPCQDLSLAGTGAGLKGERSGTFWPFWRLVKALKKEGRAPRMVVLENVTGALTSHGGKDFAAISEALGRAGYRFGAIVINAAHFVPQSRPRLFVIAALETLSIPPSLLTGAADRIWHPSSLVEALSKLSKSSRESWVWWRLPQPPIRNSTFATVIEDDPRDIAWHTAAETKRLLKMMSQTNRAKVEAAQKAGQRMIGTVYKRTRVDGRTGKKVQRAEIRFDDVAGCLRTPAGGSSRQTLMIIDGKRVRSRLLSSREAARLMGLPDTYILPQNYNEAYHLAGDGVVVPVVQYLAEHILEPLATSIYAGGAKQKAA